MWWRVGVGLALACAMIATTSEASAEDAQAYDGKVFLDWSEDAEAARCIARDRIVSEVEATLGRQVFAPKAAADRVLRVDVGATPPPGRFTAQMLLLSATGLSLGARELSVESEDCKEVSSAFTLALSIMADLPRTTEEQAAARSGTPVSPPRPTWHGTLGLGALGALDSNGDLAPGVQLGLVVRPPRFLPFGVFVSGVPRSSSTPRGMGYTLLNTTVAATLCAPPASFGRADRFAWLSCAGPDVTLYLGWGAGFTESRAGLSSTVGGTLQTYLSYSFAHMWRAFLGTGASATPQRVSLAFSEGRDEAKSVYRTPFLTAFVSIGVAGDIF
ncbi:hypothetical protein [Labilithrix luteola]|nr:hypothetical protein [Labilithrix luteola]